MKYLFWVGIVLVSLVSRTYAASFSIGAAHVSSTATRIPVEVYVDPEGKHINSLEVELTYPTEILRFVGYDEQSGSVPLWVESPSVRNGVVAFSGVIPGGIDRLYDPEKSATSPIPIVKLFFVPLQAGEGTVGIRAATALENDGHGTQLPVTLGSAPIHIVQGGTFAQTDTLPPEPFVISTIDSVAFGRTPLLAQFLAKDLGSGIEHYEVRVANRAWVVAQSPYPLPSRILPYTFAVRAYDFAGLYTEQKIRVPGIPLYKSIAGGLVVVIFGILAIRRTRTISKR